MTLTRVTDRVAELTAQLEWCQGQYAGGTPGTDHWEYVVECEAAAAAKLERIQGLLDTLAEECAEEE